VRYAEGINRVRRVLAEQHPSRRDRLIAALGAATLSTAFFVGGASSPGYRSDLDQVWYGSRMLLSGTDPYSVIGPGLAFDYGFPLYYPLPGLVAFLPLALLPLVYARIFFVAVSAALLAYAVTKDGWHRMLIFFSGAYLASLAGVQWAPLLTAAFLLPWLAPLVLVKPNIGAALTLATPDRAFLIAAATGGTVLLGLSFLIDPGWVPRWLTGVRAAPHFRPPVLHWGGALILLNILRWKRPEARLVLAMACIPHTTLAYEALPLMLVASNWKQSLLLASLSFATLVLQFHMDNRIAATDPAALEYFAQWTGAMGPVLVALVYLPATILVLRRPNEGAPPAWWRVAGSGGVAADRQVS
jgi:hypothetical protein